MKLTCNLDSSASAGSKSDDTSHLELNKALLKGVFFDNTIIPCFY